MSHPGPIVLVSSALQSRVTETLSEAGLSPVLEAGWRDALDSVQQLQPAAVIVAAPDQNHHLHELARRVASCEPYVPLIVVEPRDTLPSTAIAFNPIDGRYQRLVPRLKAALRVRSLHDTVLRRIGNDLTLRTSLQATDPRTDAPCCCSAAAAAMPRCRSRSASGSARGRRRLTTPRPPIRPPCGRRRDWRAA